MFIEKLGRLFFWQIRPSFFYLFIVLCPLSVATYLFIEYQLIYELAAQLQTIQVKSKTAVERKKRKERFVERHVNPDPYFISKQLENRPFLVREKNELKQWLEHPAISHKAPISQRLKFLEKGGNQLVFQEEEVQLSKFYKETVERQKSAVEMDQNDLKNILQVIEDLPSENPPLMQCPQLVILDFALQKKETPLDTQVVEVKIDLFKREFLSP